MTAAVPADLADRLPVAQPGWWCWRCGWWRTEQSGQYRPPECPDCGSWSRERHLPAVTIRPVLVTLEER